MLCVNEDANVIYISISQCEASSNKMREREVISEKENKLVLGEKPSFGVSVLPLMLKGSADSGSFLFIFQTWISSTREKAVIAHMRRLRHGGIVHVR